MNGPDPHLWVGILCGGIGSRFWPASLPARPKQLLSLGSERPLIRETLDRARLVTSDERVAILTGAGMASALHEVIDDVGRDRLWVEPRARGTGPALTWAAHRIHAIDPDAVLVSVHADHAIEPGHSYAQLIREAAALAVNEDLLLTVGVVPNRLETSFGYIRTGEPLVQEPGFEAHRVSKFVEKPDVEVARAYVSERLLWNTGIFVLPVSRFLHEVRTQAPEIGGCLSYLDAGDDEGFFREVVSVSVDETVFERSERLGVVRATFSWDDVGSWEALARSLPGDPDGNRGVGRAFFVDAEDSVAWAEDGPVVLYGVRDLVVVRSNGITLVTSRQESGSLKELLGQLPGWLRSGGSPSGETDYDEAHAESDP